MGTFGNNPFTDKDLLVDVILEAQGKNIPTYYEF
tara:strand:+ start:2715 stop:2816 length:102 start_codon:yes stop_codon:yes gene_type:complete